LAISKGNTWMVGRCERRQGSKHPNKTHWYKRFRTHGGRIPFEARLWPDRYVAQDQLQRFGFPRRGPEPECRLAFQADPEQDEIMNGECEERAPPHSLLHDPPLRCSGWKPKLQWSRGSVARTATISPFGTKRVSVECR
jgi:hypothetical protein